MEARLGRAVSAIADASMARTAMTDRQAEAAAALFKALADPVRLRLLSLITSHVDGQANVGELADCFDMTHSNISYHLRSLREAGLVTSHRRPPWVYYRVEWRSLSALSHLLAAPPVTPAVEG